MSVIKQCEGRGGLHMQNSELWPRGYLSITC